MTGQETTGRPYNQQPKALCIRRLAKACPRAKKSLHSLFIKARRTFPDMELSKYAYFPSVFNGFYIQLHPFSTGDRVIGESATESHELAVMQQQ
tara:strand:- start:3531 stop:3812 length:282 start_codon:yes stop_codon:yes gene_type:complete